MDDTIEKRLEELGVVLPAAAAPAANYVPYARSGSLLFTAGQLPLKDGKLAFTGLLGRDLDTAAGREAAKYCAVNVLAQTKAALGIARKDRTNRQNHGFRCLRARLHRAASGRQRRIGPVRAVLGEAGKHARSAVGMASLPLNAAVEVEAVIEVA